METFQRQVEILYKIALTSKQLEQFCSFESLLLEWNQKINLTAIRDVQGIRAKHFLDSLSLIRVFEKTPPASIIDVGTGAGFPGIPLKILFPSIRLVLVESVGKKARFCQLVVDSLGLKGVEVLASRAEEVARNPGYREKFDIAAARAVANMPVLTEYLLPLVRIGGKMIAQKGISAHEETNTAANAYRVLGGQLENIIPVELPGVPDERYLVVVKKAAATPHQYPRYAGLPAKKPL